MNFHQSTQKSEKLYFDGLFLSKAYNASVMTLKGNAKFKGKLTFGWKNDIRILVNFHASSRKSVNLHFHALLLSKVYYVLAKKSIGELCVLTLKNDSKFEEELTCELKNDVTNLANFDAALKICPLMGFF